MPNIRLEFTDVMSNYNILFPSKHLLPSYKFAKDNIIKYLNTYYAIYHMVMRIDISFMSTKDVASKMRVKAQYCKFILALLKGSYCLMSNYTNISTHYLI